MKSLLFRLSARLCIVTLLFQSLWPSVVLATQAAEVATLPLPLHSSKPFEQEFPYIDELPVDSDYTIQIGSETSTAPEALPRLSISLFQRMPQTSVHQLIAERTFYPGQTNLSEGITEVLDHQTSLGLLWSTAIGDFTIDWDGSVLLKGKSPELLAASLHIHTPGAVFLDQFNARALQLTARQAGMKSQGIIQNLALALGTVNEPGSFEVNGDLQTKTINLLRGVFVNASHITFENGGQFDLGGNPLLNYREIDSQGVLSIFHGGFMVNEGPIKAPDLYLQTNLLQNTSEIQADRLRVILAKGGKNSGTISGREKSVFVSMGEFNNTGTIDGTVLSVVVDELTNGEEGKIGSSSDTLMLHVRKGDSKGDIYAKKKANVVIKEAFVNLGEMGSEGVLNLQVDKIFINLKDIVAPQINLSGAGVTKNGGSIHGKQEIVLSSTNLINHKLVKSDQSLKVTGTSTLDNKNCVMAKTGLFAGTGQIINTFGTPTEPGMAFGEGITFDDYRGSFDNTGRFVSGGVVSGSLQKLVNGKGGVFEALGEYQLAINDLTNAGSLVGKGTLHVHTGTNAGLIEGDGLTLDVLGEMTNAGTVNVLHITGPGYFKNSSTVLFQGDTQTPSLVNCKDFQNATGSKVRGTYVIFDRNLKKWVNEDNALLEVDTILFRESAVPGQEAINEGGIFTKHLIMQRDGFQNKDVIQTNEFTLMAPTFINAQGADLDVFARTVFQTKKVHNRGTIHLKGVTTGTVTTFHNQGEARFEGKTDLKGDTLTNEDLFVGKGHLKWVINDLLNTHTFSVEISGLKALHQIINTGVMSLCRGRTEFWHFVNLRRVEWGRGIYEERIDLSKLPALPADQSTTFKKGFFENRGEVVSPKGARGLRVLGTELLNAGKIIVERLRLDLKRLTNLKRPIDPKRDPKAQAECNVLQTYQDLTGRVETIDNHDLIQSVSGKVDLQGTSLLNAGTLKAGNGVLYNGTNLTNTGEVKSPQKLKITLTGPLTNGGLLRGDQGIDLKAKDVFNTGRVEIPLTAGRSTWQIARALENTGGTIAAHAIGIYAQTVHNRKTISLTGTSFLRAWRDLVNDGSIAGEDLSVSAATLTNNKQIAADNKLLVEADKLKTHKDHELYGEHALTLKVKQETVNEGLIQSENLTIEAPKLINKGTLRGTHTTTIKTPNGFENKQGAVANLKGLTLDQGWSGFWMNNGNLILSDVRSLGGVRHLWNGLGAKMSVKDSTFKLDELTSYGYLDLATGTYTIDTFKAESSATTFLLGGAHLFYGKKFDNQGVLKAPIGLMVKVDRQDGVHLGDLKVQGDLILELGQNAQPGQAFSAAKFLDEQMPQTEYNGELIIKTPRFDNPYKLSTPKSLQLYTAFFNNQGALAAGKLLIRSTSGFINTGDVGSKGELDIEASCAIDNKVGHIFGKGKTRVVSTQGSIFNGAQTNGHSRNSSYIFSDSFLEISALHYFYNTFGTVFSHEAYDISAGVRVENKVGLIWGDAGGRIKTPDLQDICESPSSERKQKKIGTRKEVKHGGGWFSSWREEYPVDVYEDYIAYTDVSEGGQIYAGSDLVLDVNRLYVFGSKICAGGWIYDGLKRQLPGVMPQTGQTYNFSLGQIYSSPGGNPAMLLARQGIDFRKLPGNTGKNFDITGVIQGGNIFLDVSNFRLENADNKRSASGAQTVLVINMTRLAEKLATPGGMVQQFGPTAQHRIAFGPSVTQAADPDPRKITYLGGFPEGPVRFTVDPKTLEMVIRMYLTDYIGTEALLPNLMDLWHQNGKKQTGKEVISSQDLQSQQLARIVYQEQPIFDTTMEIARMRGELDAILCIPKSLQNPKLHDSGYVNGKHTLKVEAENSFTNLSGEMETADLEVHSKGGVRVETKTQTFITQDGNSVTIKEVVCPVAKMTGTHSSSVIGDQFSDTKGAEFYSGPGGAKYGSTHGKATDRPVVLTERTKTWGSRKTGGLFSTKTDWQVEEIMQSAGPRTRYSFTAPITHIGGAGIHQIGTEHRGTGDVFYEGDLLQEAAVLMKKRKETVSKDGLFVSSDSSQQAEAADFVQSILDIPHHTVHFNGRGASKILGTDIHGSVEDNTGSLTVGMTVTELHQSSSQSKSALLGEGSCEREGKQEVGCPSRVVGPSWESKGKGRPLSLQSALVCMDKFYAEKDVRQETVQLASSQTMKSSQSGFILPKFQDPLVSSLGALGGKQHMSDRAASVMGATSEALRGFSDLQGLMGGGSLAPIFARYATVSWGFQQSRSSFDEKLAQPSVLMAEVMVFDNQSTHIEGTLKAGKLVLLTKSFTTSAAKDEASSFHESSGGSFGINLVTRMPSVSVNASEGDSEQTKHKFTTITADNIFIRADNVVFSGTQIRAKLIDAIIKENLTIEAVLDTFRSSHTGVSFSSSGDIRAADQQRQIEKINAIASIIGTEQFYLQVGKTLLTRSGEFGLRPDGVVAPHVTTPDGKPQYIRPMPTVDNACGFFGLLNHTGTATPRKYAVALLMSHAGDASIRALVAPELIEAFREGRDMLTLPGANVLRGRYMQAGEDLDAMVRAANTDLGVSGQTAVQLLETDPEGTDTRLDAVRQTLIALAEVESEVMAWAQSQPTYTAYIQGVIGKPNHMITYVRSEATGVMDAIAKLEGRNLVIYQADDKGVITSVHEYDGVPQAPVIPLLHTSAGDDEPNHFDLLEGTVSSVHAQEIIDEKLKEIDKETGFVANMPFGTAMTLMGQIDELTALKSHIMEGLLEEGMPVDEAAETIAQLEGVDQEELDAIIAAAEDPGEEEPQPVVAPKPTRKDKVPVAFTEQDITDVSDTIAAIQKRREPVEEKEQPATKQDMADVSDAIGAIQRDRKKAGAVAAPKPVALLERAGGDVSQMGCNPEMAFTEYVALDHTSPDHLKDTYGEEAKQAVKGAVVGAYEAKDRVSEGQAGKPLPAAYFGGSAASEFFDQMFDERGGASDQAKAGAAQALDALAKATQCVDTCMFGALSALGVATDKAGEALGTGARRTVRTLTGRQNWGQNAGDAVEGAFQALSCVFGPGKSKIAQKAAALSKVAKEAAAAAKLAKTAVKAEHAAEVLDKGPYQARLMGAMLRERYKGHTVTSGTLPERFQPNVKLAGKSLHIPGLGVSIPFDIRGLPIFDKHIKFETRISGDLAKMSSEAHKRQATLSLKECITSGHIDAKIFTPEQLKAINAGKSQVPDYIWHHHQEMGRMQLVPKDIHKAAGHIGGDCLWRK